MEHDEAPLQPGLAVGALERVLQPLALGPGGQIVHPVEEEEARVAEAHGAVGLGDGGRVGESEVALEVRARSVVVELVVADGGEERALAEQRLLDVEERLPVRRAGAVLDHVAGVHEEIGRDGAHRSHDAGVRRVVRPVVPVDEERQRRAGVGPRRGDDAPVGDDRAADPHPQRVGRRGLQPGHVHPVHRRHFAALEAAGARARRRRRPRSSAR